MSTLALRRHSRELWQCPKLQRKWVRSVLRLGDKWLYANHVERKENVK